VDSIMRHGQCTFGFKTCRDTYGTSPTTQLSCGVVVM
jgi:hypothetical protein